MRLAWLLVLAVGCDDGRAARGFVPTGAGPGTRVDSGLAADLDAGASAPDAKSQPDAEPMDGTFHYFDAHVGGADASGAQDASTPSFPDAQPSFPDAQPSFPDAQPPPGAGDIWIEIDYSSAPTPRSPTFRYSNTPGWGEVQWAAVNASWPEAWDRFNNMQVVDDPIGRALEIGGGSELQLMIGLEELVAYDWAEVEIEGRSRATSSSVMFNVYNPWNGCGAGGSFGQQWTVQSETLDLAQCYEVGQGVQAVRVDPGSGTVALVRLRLTLHGAVY